MGWLFLAAGLALGLNAFAGPYGLHAVRVAPGSLPAGRAVAWLSNWGVRDSGRDAGLSAAAVPERAAAFAAVAPGGVVRGSRVHVSG
jgi:hypothetical protein